MVTMQRTREYAKCHWCEKDNKISFPMADSDCHAPPSRRSFSGDFAQRLATPCTFAHRVTLHHFRLIAPRCNRHEDDNVQSFLGPRTQLKTRTNEFPCQRKRRPRQARLLFARRTEYYSVHCCQRKKCKVRAAIKQ